MTANLDRNFKLIKLNQKLSVLSNSLSSKEWHQRAKKVVSDSPGLVDFAIGQQEGILHACIR